MSIFQNVTEAFFVPQRSIGPFTATVTIEEKGNDELEITEHPVQKGAVITDHSFKKPASLSVNVAFDYSDGSPAETYENLLTLQSNRIPFEVVTGKRSYQNMLIKSLSQTTDAKTENCLAVQMELNEIVITTVSVVQVPERAKQKNPKKTAATQNAGSKSAKEATKAENVSAIKEAERIGNKIVKVFGG